jgi:tRNA nucleotidyltransferase (CCA-adding enzyme)
MEPHWEHFRHEADVGVRGIAPTLGGAFEQAALAMTAVITDPAAVAALTPVAVECAAPDAEILLADWLNALVFEMATRRMLFGRFEVAVEDGRLHAAAWGELVDAQRHKPAVEVKGATFTALRVAREPDGAWIAQCVVDV